MFLFLFYAVKHKVLCYLLHLVLGKSNVLGSLTLSII